METLTLTITLLLLPFSEIKHPALVLTGRRRETMKATVFPLNWIKCEAGLIHSQKRRT